MAVELMNPDGLPRPDVYRQVAVATGTRSCSFPARWRARLADGAPVGAGDLAAQVEQAMRNVATGVSGRRILRRRRQAHHLRRGLDARQDGRRRRRCRSSRRQPSASTRPRQSRSSA